MSSFDAYSMVVLVHDFGEPLTLIKSPAGSYDPATSGFSATQTNYRVTGYFHKSTQGVVPGNNTQRGNLVCALAGQSLPVVPSANDQISSPRGVFHISEVDTVYSEGEAVVYLCRIRE